LWLSRGFHSLELARRPDPRNPVQVPEVFSVLAVDLDGDGDMDVLAAAKASSSVYAVAPSRRRVNPACLFP
jgi:hypothetical protein